jgi:hypothetical protein
MSDLSRIPGRRLAALVGGCVLLAGLAVLPGTTASAAVCGTATVAGAGCTSTGTVSVTAGTLSLTSPSALGWTASVTGLDQNLVDATTAHQTFTVTDATGSGAGWHITVSATQFTTGTKTLANTGSFSLTGSVTSLTATTAPTAACGGGSSCVLPTNGTTYPVAVTTATTAPPPVTIYATAAATGLGTIGIGAPGANPVGWWVVLPGSVAAGAYTSTVTMTIISGP